MSKKTLEINSENILPIIKKWLYSDRDIFSRELVSNACDAIKKLCMVKKQEDKGNLKIEIRADKAQKTLHFIDTGIGMDAGEVEKYIAQIAFSSAEEFLEKYKSDNESDQFIGHFGLGFYSAYMVADRVEIETLSYKEEAKPVHWECDGSSEYTIEEGSRKERGTEVILHIGKDNEEFLDISHLKKTLEHYCAFLPYPVFLGDEQINTHEPLWIKPPSECKEEDYLTFYRYLYPMEPDPLFWVHLNVDYPFHLKGILYFPKIQRDFNPEKSSVKLYCNRVFVADQCKDVIPNYLMMLKGVIDSPDIPLNVSRSYLQMDKTVRQLSNHISKKVSDALQALYKTDRQKFDKCWPDASLVVKFGVIEDEKFYERVKEILLWKQMNGEYTTAEEYLERNGKKTDQKLLYAKDEHHLSHLHPIFKEKEIDILICNDPIDQYVMRHLEQKLSPAKFQRIDAAAKDHLVDTSQNETDKEKIVEVLKEHIGSNTLEIEAKGLHNSSFAAFVQVDEDQRRMEEYMRAINPNGSAELEGFSKKTFVANTNHPLIASLPNIAKDYPDLAKELAEQLLDLSLLAQKELPASKLNTFLDRTHSLLSQLVKQKE